MRCLIVAVAFLAMTVQAHVGTDQNGEKASMSGYYENYLLCGKCVHGGGSGTRPWFKLVCDAAATNSSNFATLSSSCDSSCSSCETTTAITIGQEIGAAFNSNMLIYTSSFFSYSTGLHTAASIQCCPQVIETAKYLSTDTTCSGTVQSTTYKLAGCQLQGSSNLTNIYGTTYCGSNGASPTVYRAYCIGTDYLKSGDECPTTHSNCLMEITSVSNSPCWKVHAGYMGVGYNGTLNMTHGMTETQRCQIDGTQMCLRTVLSSKYLANMTTGTDDISALSCSAANTGTTVGQLSGASSVATFAAAIAVAVASLF